MSRLVQGASEHPTSSRTDGMNASENDLRTFPGRECTPGRGFLVPWLGGVGVGASVNWMLTYVGWDVEVGSKVDE